MATLRLILTTLWFFLSCLAGFFMALVRWGDLNVVSDIGRIMSVGMLPLARVRVELEGAEHLGEANRPCLYLGNHQSAFDLPVYGTFGLRRTVAVGKRELNWVPLFNLAWMATGNISIDRGNRSRAMASLEKAARLIRERRASVLLFPEGTRNRTDQPLLPFKKGAFHLAIAAQVPIVPIVISDYRPMFRKGRFGQGVVRVKVLPPVPTQGVAREEVDGLSQKVRESMLQALADLKTAAQA